MDVIGLKSRHEQGCCFFLEAQAESVPLVIQVVGRTKILVVEGLRFLFSCWQLPKGHSQLLEAIWIPWIFGWWKISATIFKAGSRRLVPHTLTNSPALLFHFLGLMQLHWAHQNNPEQSSHCNVFQLNSSFKILSAMDYNIFIDSMDILRTIVLAYCRLSLTNSCPHPQPAVSCASDFLLSPEILSTLQFLQQVKVSFPTWPLYVLILLPGALLLLSSPHSSFRSQQSALLHPNWASIPLCREIAFLSLLHHHLHPTLSVSG